MQRFLRTVLAAWLLVCTHAFSEEKAVPAGDGQTAAKTAKDLIRKHTPLVIQPDQYSRALPENTRIVIHLSSQRLMLMMGENLCLDTPISSGKRGMPTLPGTYSVLEKIKSHESATYGSFVDKRGRTVRSGISMKLDAAPAGTHYVADAMPYFCRFTETGFGIHSGFLPGYPAAHGSIRVPEDAARFIFEKVRVGTPIEIRAD